VGKRPLERPVRRWEFNTKIDFKEAQGYDGSRDTSVGIATGYGLDD
jgi:hypothetical protein